mgnify:CR=1 FL=1
MRLKDISVVPPTGFNYQDYDTKAVITASSFNDLLANVHRHRHLNGLTLHGNQEQMIHDQLCDKLGSEYCESYGLGDAVHAVAQPIAKAIDYVAGTHIGGCGSCAKRRATLNS